MRFEKMKIALAWALPSDIAYWAAIRVGANACGSKYPTQEVPALLFSEALQRWPADPYTPPSAGQRWHRLKRAVAEALSGRALRLGLAPGAIEPEVDDVATLPEYQRTWYAQDPATKKYKIDFSKVDVEDINGLRSTVTAAREEAKQAKLSQAQAVKDALKPYEGIDPVKTRAMYDAFASDEEKRLMAQGPEGMKKVIDQRMVNERAEYTKQVDEAKAKESAAMEVSATLMEKVLDNYVRAAAADAGLVPSAISDALRAAREVFSLSDDCTTAVQYAEDGETVVMGKDPKVAFSPKEWLEQQKAKSPHWFPAGGAGGGAGGSKGGGGGADLSGLSATARLTHARENPGQQRK